jgi:[ribosomal protein S18]-alanine N-acetyltransferase
VARAAPLAVLAQIVSSVGELAPLADAEPWRVRATGSGETAILGRWRAHLPDCAVLGLWCSVRRVPVIVRDLVEVAREQGFERLVGPLVPECEAGMYVRAGLHVIQRVVVMRVETPAPIRVTRRPDGLVVRDAVESDLDALHALDAECFDPFWHYDPASLARFARIGRVAVGVLDGRTVGYTLSTLRSGEGSLGRLAVTPAFRRRGIGRALATEALEWSAARGARYVVLSTQEDNTASRTLYRTIGFDETGDVLVACASGALSDVVPRAEGVA